MRKKVKTNGKVTRIRMRAVPESGRRSMIITFKQKERRPDAHLDKLDIVRQACAAPLNFFDAMTAPPVEQAIPMGLPGELVGFDVNEYDAPIVVASLTQDEVGKLEKNGNVASVEEDGICYAVEGARALVPYRAEPSPSYGSHQPAPLIIEGQPTLMAETIPAGIAQVKAPGAWNCSRGMGIRVAVLDTGIDSMHPDLAPNFAGGVSFVPGQTFRDGNGHGTHCAGTIGAAINGSGVVGVAPSASLYAVKVLSNGGSGQWSWLIAGIDWCIKNQMRVLSMSMGGYSAPTALQLMCNAAFQKGLLLVGAAGNEANRPVIFPARYASVIAVSAIDSANNVAPFSARGPEVELCAPGVNVLSTLPGGGYGSMSGTSMACPHASGTAAVTWGAHRYATNVTIRRLLAYTADNLGVPGRDPAFGFGRVDAAQAAFQLTPPPAIPGLP